MCLLIPLGDLLHWWQRWLKLTTFLCKIRTYLLHWWQRWLKLTTFLCKIRTYLLHWWQRWFNFIIARFEPPSICITLVAAVRDFVPVLKIYCLRNFSLVVAVLSQSLSSVSLLVPITLMAASNDERKAPLIGPNRVSEPMTI